jgi:hypothetical protein
MLIAKHRGCYSLLRNHCQMFMIPSQWSAQSNGEAEFGSPEGAAGQGGNEVWRV